MSQLEHAADCPLSVIVPTYREADNIAELADRLFEAIGKHPGLAGAELIVVDDDSRDGIDRVIAESPHAGRIRLVVRTAERGLASAVLRGLKLARGRHFVVMDADLSHPPEAVPELLGPLLAGQADMVVGSRYVPGASTDSEWSWFRRVNSRVATVLARPFARITDPMSGFFAMERSALQHAGFLNPTGYKIALELMVKCRCRRVAEVPIHFADRRRGKSKLTLREQLRYVEHLSRLYDFKYPRLVPVAKFLIVTFVGFLLGCGWIALGHAAGRAGPGNLVGRDWLLLAFWPAVAVNLLAYWRYIKQMRGLVPIRRPKLEFLIISVFEWITYAAAVYWWLDGRHGLGWPDWLAAAPFCFAAAFATRFVLRKLAGHDIRGLPANAPADTPAPVSGRPPAASRPGGGDPSPVTGAREERDWQAHQ